MLLKFSLNLDDGSSLDFNCIDYKALDMIAQLNKKSRTMD